MELGGEEATTAEYLRTMAVARVFLDNFRNLQASWVTQGPKVGAASLAFGVNDMGSTMIEENVVASAGTVHRMLEPEIVAAIRDAGFVPMRRDMQYGRLGGPTPIADALDFDRIWVDRDLQVRAGMRTAATWKALYRHGHADGWTHLVSYDAEAARLLEVIGITADGRFLQGMAAR